MSIVAQIDHPLWLKANGVLRLALVRSNSTLRRGHLVVNEYPKSGASWLAQMLSDATGLPFPRNRLPMFRASILHGHYLSPRGMRRPVVMWRDGRDVMVSFYYHRVVGNEYTSVEPVRELRRRLGIVDPADIRANLPAFIEFMSASPLHPRFSWAAFVDTWAGRKEVVETSYEALRENTVRELRRVVAELGYPDPGDGRADEIANKYSFARQKGDANAKGAGAAYLRKGIVGDWRNAFTREAAMVFERHSGAALRKLGYEQDPDWVESVDTSN